MKTASELREKFNSDLIELQNNCKHENCELLDYEFAPGHFSGMKINICKICEKVVPINDKAAQE